MRTFWTFRLFLLPISSAFIVGILAFSEWSKIRNIDSKVQSFRKNSKIKVFTPATSTKIDGRERPVYHYQDEGEVREFISVWKIRLPNDGRVRVGPDPFFEESQFSSLAVTEIAVPIYHDDSPEALYAEFKGKERKSDIFKASIVSLAAVITAIAGFFLQRTLIRAFKRHRPHRY